MTKEYFHEMKHIHFCNIHIRVRNSLYKIMSETAVVITTRKENETRYIFIDLF